MEGCFPDTSHCASLVAQGELADEAQWAGMVPLPGHSIMDGILRAWVGVSS